MKIFLTIITLSLFVSHSYACVSDLQELVNDLINNIPFPPAPTTKKTTTTTKLTSETTTTAPKTETSTNKISTTPFVETTTITTIKTTKTTAYTTENASTETKNTTNIITSALTSETTTKEIKTTSLEPFNTTEKFNSTKPFNTTEKFNSTEPFSTTEKFNSTEPLRTTSLFYNETKTTKTVSSTSLPKFNCSYGSASNGKNCDECGLTNFTTNLKIYGGIEAIAHSWPAHVLIYREYTFFYNNQFVTSSSLCGGTLIKKNVVLTAAHCLFSEFRFNNMAFSYEPNFLNPTFESTFKIYLGLHDRSFLDDLFDTLPENAVMASVAKVIQHKNYDENTVLNDIGLLVLDQEVDLNAYIKLACLPKQESSDIPAPFTPSWITGWGVTETQKQGSNVLMNVKITSYNSSMCSLVFPNVKKNWDAQICAGEYSGSKDTCQGDSGGALYIKETINGQAKFIVAGITSYGDGCGLAKKPGIYTRVSYYIGWIEKSLSDYFDLVK